VGHLRFGRCGFPGADGEPVLDGRRPPSLAPGRAAAVQKGGRGRWYHPPMRYRLSMPEPHSHLFHVEAALEGPGAEVVLALPVWTPGSYLVREFARHLEGFSAADEQGGPLAWERLDKHRFRVRCGGAARALFRYRVYANDLTVRTSHLDGSHGYANGASVLVYAEGRGQEPCTLEVFPPPGWRVTCPLDGGPTEFTARDYDELVDSPIEIGTHALLEFAALGKPHTLAVWGKGELDLGAFAADLRRVVEQHGAMLGGLPYSRYLFLVHLSDRRRGGLEHARSTTIHLSRMGFKPDKAYAEALSLAVHEFLHVWNVKKLRPAALQPYDYSREQYTRLLWWFEGVTSYYDHLLLVRAGLLPAPRYLKHLGEELTALERSPGAGKMSLEEASLTAWVKHYRPDENSGNSAVSYYRKGELAGLALDLFLRRHGRSLLAHQHPCFCKDVAEYHADITRALEEMKTEGVDPGIVHAANSPATILYPGSHFDMVRCGIAIYGLHPAPSTRGVIELEPARSVLARVSFVKRIGMGDGVSYGLTWQAAAPTYIATIPLGYADGVHRASSNGMVVLIGGQRCRQVGRICMDQFMVEVPRGMTVSRGDEVVVVGAQGSERITLDDLADSAATINYELSCSFGARLERVYS